MNNKILAIIPTRSGSKSIPNKNIIKVNKKPLIYYTIQQAKKSKFITDLIVSTDSLKIKKIAKKYGVDTPFLRPKKYASDTSPSIELVLDILMKYNMYEYVILLQPTTPLRTTKDIDNIIKYSLDKKIDSIASISKVTQYPELMYKLKNNKIVRRFKLNSNNNMRQKYEKLYYLNGSIYLCKTRLLKKYKKFINSETCGYLTPDKSSLDIDSYHDLDIFKNTLK